MSIQRDESGRINIETPLTAESLMDKRLLQGTDAGPIFRPVPDLNVIKLGGQSIIDRGGAVVKPILEEIIAARPDHKLLIMTGGGTRSRHAYTIGLDLGMPPGILARLGSSISEQNALMISMLLAPHGGVKILHEDAVKLPGYLMLGSIPVMPGMPPYDLWEAPPTLGRIPDRRTDFGTFVLAEVLGAKSCILVKDEDGLFTADPKKQPDAELIPEISVDDLLARDLDDLAVERSMLDAMRHAHSVKSVQIVNGRVPGNLTKALAGEQVGSRIFVD